MMSIPVVIFRPVCLEKVVVVTCFDASSPKEYKGVAKEVS